MIDGAEGLRGLAHAQPPLGESLEGLARGQLVEQVEVHVEHGRPAPGCLPDLVLAPDLLEEGARRVAVHRVTTVLTLIHLGSFRGGAQDGPP